jgi:hypothetical protein
MWLAAKRPILVHYLIRREANDVLSLANLTLEETLAEQENLAWLCADRPEKTEELFNGSAFYGMARILKEYAGLPTKRSLKAVIPHGLVFSPDHIWEAEIHAALPVVLCYPAYREGVYGRRTTKLVIPSASPFLYLLELLRAHRPPARQGTIFFPSHSTHNVTAQFDFEGLADALLLLGEEYQPITVCVYWRDFNLGRHVPFQERGFRVVSAGHMFDPHFLVRFYHLCSTHQYSASNSIGSNLFYSAKSGCSFFLMDGFDTTLVGEPEVLKRNTAEMPDSIHSSLHRLFCTPRVQMSREQMEAVDYFLGAEHLKSSRTLRHQLYYAELLDQTRFLPRNGGRQIRLLIPPYYRRVGQRLLRWSDARFSAPRR